MKELSKTQVDKIKSFNTKSATIRLLTSLEYSRSEIVKLFKTHLDTTILYQHVRNVQLTVVKTPTES